MQKKALLALLLALTLCLSGCALIVKDEAVDAATVILTFGDKTVTKGEILKAAEEELLNNSYMYQMYGYSYDATDPDNIKAAREAAIENMKTSMIQEAKIAELGLTLTEEEEKAAEEDAQSDYDYAVDYVKNNVLQDSGLEGEELDKAVEEEMTKRGISKDQYLKDARTSALNDKLREYIIKDVTVSDEEIQAEYNTQVASSKETYGENPGAYASAVNKGTTVYYAPEGVRRVKNLLTKFHEEDQTAIDDANAKVSAANTAISSANTMINDSQEIIDDAEATEEAKTQAQADLATAQANLEKANADLEAANAELAAAREKGYANLDEEVDAILTQLAEGADWDTLMAEKTQDPGMKSGTSSEKGYAISADMTGFDPAFVEAGMALEKIGDYSGKVAGDSYGYYIIRYVADEPAGEIGLDNVKDEIREDLLSKKQDETYDSTLAEWVEQAGFKVDMNALNN